VRGKDKKRKFLYYQAIGEKGIRFFLIISYKLGIQFKSFVLRPQEENKPLIGIRKINLLPLPSPSLSAQILPPCNSTNLFVRVRPNPVP
jgi:hypothetical protein